jgi:hypothetical protein
MSTFGDDLIEHRPGAVFLITAHKQLETGSIALAENLNINANAKTGVSNEQIVPYLFLFGGFSHNRA